MLKTSESPAVAIARAHAEAWSNHDYDTARKSLAPEVKATASNTMGYPNLDLVGIEDYMGRITEFANSVKPGSLRVNASMGDERNAILMVTLQTDGQYGAITFHMARLYLLNDNDKIKEEKVIYYTVKD